MPEQMAFVLLAQPVAIDIKAVVQAMQERYPTLAVEVSADNEKSHILSCDGQQLAIMNMPAPVPQDGGEEIWARAAATWAEAPTVQQKHGAHIIVAVLGKVPPLSEARLVTAVAGGLLDVVPECLAVMWAARLVRAAEAFKDASRAALDEQQPPILSWIDLTPVRAASGFDVVTVGLSSFMGREIEWPVGRRGSETFGLVANLAAYLVLNGDAIKDGDTIGEDANERIKVRHRTSAHVDGLPVLRIEEI